MAKMGLIVLTAVGLVAASAFGADTDDARRPPTERRPYIIEVGEPYSLSMSGVHSESGRISHLRTYLEQYGYPDYAEIQEIEPQWPWESYEVRLYYMRRDLEADFAHVFLSPAEPGFGEIRFQGLITPEKRHEIEVILAAREAPPPPPVQSTEPEEGLGTAHLESLVARVEAAAERASQAADRAVESSEAAKRAADRTVQVVDQLIEQQSH
jgi:hypothetical protein